MMTRPEYKQAVRERWPDARPEIRSFPLLLKDVSAQLFIEQDITSDLAKETIRRLKQLENTGITDP